MGTKEGGGIGSMPSLKQTWGRGREMACRGKNQRSNGNNIVGKKRIPQQYIQNTHKDHYTKRVVNRGFLYIHRSRKKQESKERRDQLLLVTVRSLRKDAPEQIILGTHPKRKKERRLKASGKQFMFSIKPPRKLHNWYVQKFSSLGSGGGEK